jgi:copper(I)-binding protein
MLFGRTRTLQAGDDVSITLEFADGERLTVPFALREATAR